MRKTSIQKPLISIRRVNGTYEARLDGFGIVGNGGTEQAAIMDLQKWVRFSGLMAWSNDYTISRIT